MTDMAARATAAARQEYLGSLVTVLTARGFEAALGSSKTGVPLAQVTNREVRALSDTVMCAQDPDGALSLFWPWGKRIGPADDPHAAADEVERVLGV